MAEMIFWVSIAPCSPPVMLNTPTVGMSLEMRGDCNCSGMGKFGPTGMKWLRVISGEELSAALLPASSFRSASGGRTPSIELIVFGEIFWFVEAVGSVYTALVGTKGSHDSLNSGTVKIA